MTALRGRPVRRVRLGLAAAAAASLAALAGTPLYDGVGFPDQPYRFAGGNPPPTSATVSVVLTRGSSQASYVATREVGPQLSVDLPPGTLAAAAPQVTVTVVPRSPQGAPPRGEWDSNAYVLTAGPAAVRFSGRGAVILRSAVMTTPDPVAVVRLVGERSWHEAPTRRVGNDILETSLAGRGEYALVRLPGAKPLGGSGGGGSPLDDAVWLLVGVGFVVLVGSAGVSVARERRRRGGAGR